MQPVAPAIAESMASSSFIRKMFEKGLELKRQFGEGAVCDFSLGNPDVPPPARVRDELVRLVNANFDLRSRIFSIAEENRRMVMTARSSGASAKFAGSGGAIVGTFEGDDQYKSLERALALIGCRTIRPTIAVDDTLPSSGTAPWRNA